MYRLNFLFFNLSNKFPELKAIWMSANEICYLIKYFWNTSHDCTLYYMKNYGEKNWKGCQDRNKIKEKGWHIKLTKYFICSSNDHIKYKLEGGYQKNILFSLIYNNNLWEVSMWTLTYYKGSLCILSHSVIKFFLSKGNSDCII